MGIEQGGLGMAGKTDDGAAPEPWPRTDGRKPDQGLMRVLLIPRSLGRSPDAEQLAHAGIVLHEQLAHLVSLADNAALLDEAEALVVELDPALPADMEAFDRLVHLAHGKMAVIAAVDGLTVASTRALLRAGAVDVLPIPFSTDELKQAVEPARRVVRSAPVRTGAPVRRQGKVVAFLNALGGAGSTALATQAGIMWASTTRIGFVDFDVQFGSAALLLDLRPSLNIANLIEDAERLDTELLQSVALRHASGLEVVASPTDMIPLESVTVEFVDQVLRTAAQGYDVVLVDLPNAWTEWTVRVLQRADLICLVTNLTVPGIYQARRQLEVLDANGLTSKLVTIANRVETTMFGRKADTKETEAVLGRKIDHSVADDTPTMRSATDEGRPVKEVRASSRMVKDLKALVDSLSETLSADVSPL